MQISIETTVNAPIEDVWAAWTTPDDIVRWNFASPEWHCPAADIDLTDGGRFNYRMEARDGSAGFDFEGTFEQIDPLREIRYAIADGRKVSVRFESTDGGVMVRETFEAETVHDVELQRQGWLSILNNFKTHVESKSG